MIKMVTKEEKKALAKAQEEKERLEAMAKRVDEARKTLRAKRESVKAKAPLLTREVLEGIDYSEEAVVKLVNGKYGKVIIHPLAEGVGIGAFAKLDLSGLRDVDKPSNSFTKEEYEFFWSIVAASTGLPVKLIKKTFAIGESALLTERILEMSGLGPETEDEVEDF